MINNSIEVGNHVYTGQARELQSANRFAFAGKTYKNGIRGFYGNQGPGYSASKIAAAKIGQARLATAGKIIRGGTVGVGLFLSAAEVVEGGGSNRSYAQGGMGLLETGKAFIPPPGLGLGISITISIVDASHGFDWLYNKFDNTPRFQNSGSRAQPAGAPTP